MIYRFITTIMVVIAMLFVAPPAQARSLHDLHIRNAGNFGMFVCTHWNYVPGVKSGETCGPDQSFTYLRPKQTSRSLGLSDIDAVCAYRGYKVQRLQRYGVWRTISGRGVPPTKYVWCWKVRPSLVATGTFRLVSVRASGGGSW